MNTKITLFLISILLCSMTGLSQETGNIEFINEPISIDGKLNEPVWGKLLENTDFNNFYPDDEGKAKNQTTVKFYHDGINLYIAAVYSDDTNKSLVSSLKRDDYLGIIIDSDNLQVVIDTYNKKANGYFFCVNIKNTKLDGLISFDGAGYSNNESWNMVWESATSIDGNKKIYEIAIPLKSLDFDPNNTTWALNFIVRDVKSNNWMTLTDMSRNYLQHDLRTTKLFTIDKLPKSNTSKLILTPSIAYNYQKDLTSNSNQQNFTPSLDVQFKINSSLKLDATINPDFSQIEVDQQVTNLTRFELNLPERRNFFLENGDLFSNLGTDEVNPFYSRRIGETNDIKAGLKFSGNISPKSRIGILNVQTYRNEANNSQNYGAFVFQQQLFKTWTATAFVVNRQETVKTDFIDNYNRVFGLNLNYKSKNNKWTGLANYGKSITHKTSNKNKFLNAEINYSTKKISGKLSLSTIDKNYLTDMGFAPRLYNYDPISSIVERQGFSKSHGSLSMFSYPKQSKTIQTIRYFNPSNTIYFDNSGEIFQSFTNVNQALWFKNSSSVFINYLHEYDNLKFVFDLLGNGNNLEKKTYNSLMIQTGYNSMDTKNLLYGVHVLYGSYYDGRRTGLSLNASYRLLPAARLRIDYEINRIDLNDLGSSDFHLARFTGEIFFNNQLNWTTYLQYNTQQNNFNINSRLQWEYKPLSYVYLVVTDNFDKTLKQQNWGVAFKVNYRFEL